METIKTNGCEISAYKGKIKLISGATEAVFYAYENGLVLESLKNTLTGYNWVSGKKRSVVNPIKDNILSFKGITMNELDNDGMSKPYLAAEISYAGSKADIKAVLSVYPGISLINLAVFCARPAEQDNFDVKDDIEFSDGDITFSLSLVPKHYKCRVAELFDYSDITNTFVKKYDDFTYKSGSRKFDGHFLVLDSYLDREQLFVVREAPTKFGAQNRRSQNDFAVYSDTVLDVTGTSLPDELDDDGHYISCYPVTFGCFSAPDEEIYAEYRKLYRAVSLGIHEDKLFTLSNTWGDRGEGANLNEKFMKKEIEAASGLGIDVVQIDAGWSTGDWEIKKDRFPDGFAPLKKLCTEKGIEFGSYMDPRKPDEYADWEKDADIMIKYFTDYGVTHVKFDGVTINTKRAEENILKIFKKFYEKTGHHAQINNDITASRRFGFLYEKQYASLFVCNRYTDWHNYYPHYTLRTLWQLCEFIPARRMQIEFLNNKRNRSLYEGDPLAPANYEMDYLFATAMLANPLVWMDLQSIEPSDAELLKKIISVYKPLQKQLFDADVSPIGEIPDGGSFTGFNAKIGNGGYLLLFAEAGGTYIYSVKGVRNPEVLYKSEKLSDFGIECYPYGVRVNMPEEKSFVFIRYSC